MFPVSAGVLELAAAGTGAGAVISGRFSGAVDFPAPSAVSAEAEPTAPGAVECGPVINEIAAQEEPHDWVELCNAAESEMAMSGFVLADELTDVGKRTPFPSGL